MVGRALSEPARVAMVDRLMSGTAHTATELAFAARIAASTASEHLRILIDAGLVLTEPAGRHRYYRLASADIAEWLEQIDQIDLPNEAHRRATAARPTNSLWFARSCYDHLAGKTGVLLFEALAGADIVRADGTGGVITESGKVRLARIGIDTETLAGQRRPMIRTCLDWTERRHHLAGSLGASLLEVFLEERWFTRKPGNRRLLVATSAGRRNLEQHFSIR